MKEDQTGWPYEDSEPYIYDGFWTTLGPDGPEFRQPADIWRKNFQEALGTALEWQKKAERQPGGLDSLFTEEA